MKVSGLWLQKIFTNSSQAACFYFIACHVKKKDLLKIMSTDIMSKLNNEVVLHEAITNVKYKL